MSIAISEMLDGEASPDEVEETNFKTKIVRRDEGTYSKSGSLSSKYVTKAQEYDFTITKNDTSFEGKTRFLSILGVEQ